MPARSASRPTAARAAAAKQRRLAADARVAAELEGAGKLGGPERWISLVVLALMTVLPLAASVIRRANWQGEDHPIGTLIYGCAAPITQHLTLIIAFAGAVLAARANSLLTLSTSNFLPPRAALVARAVTGGLGAVICAVLAYASGQMVAADRLGGEEVALGIPVWVFELALPIGYGVIGIWLVWWAFNRSPQRLAAALLCLLAAVLVVPSVLNRAPDLVPFLQGPGVRTAGIVLMIAATFAGLPLFLLLGGLAVVLFWSAGTPLASVPAETYRLAANPMLPAVPLFTLAGHIMAAGGACKRLVRVFDALLGWMPGGLAIVAALVFAFFTSFTGGSGVTILSLGGLLLPVLLRSKYPESFSIGLLTASGSIGLLFPPSLPVILYGVRSLTMVNGQPYVAPIDQLFIAGFVPGLFLVGLVALWGIRTGLLTGAGRKPFRLREAVASVWQAKWELVLPVIIVVGYLSGLMSLVETAALTLLWTVAAECWIYQDLSVRKDLMPVIADGSALVGGVLLILGAALGFTNYLVDARAPELLTSFVQEHVHSKFMFLLLLNVAMIVVGSVIEIYSAILVVVPLVTPMGAAFGVDPVHLGIIFLANLELGYLFPPVGLNLLLASYRFGKPMAEVARATVPFLLILTAGVLLITYVPVMSLGLLRLLHPAVP